MAMDMRHGLQIDGGIVRIRHNMEQKLLMMHTEPTFNPEDSPG
jgi:hypothetical protein